MKQKIWSHLYSLFTMAFPSFCICVYLYYCITRHPKDAPPAVETLTPRMFVTMTICENKKVLTGLKCIPIHLFLSFFVSLPGNLTNLIISSLNAAPAAIQRCFQLLTCAFVGTMQKAFFQKIKATVVHIFPWLLFLDTLDNIGLHQC